MYPRIEPGGPFGPEGLERTHRAVGPWFFIGRFVPVLIFVLLVALAAFLLYRLLSRPPAGWSGAATAALRELEMRYARGEIGREEFLQRRSDLTSPAIPAPPAAALPPPTPPPPNATPPTPPSAATSRGPRPKPDA